MFFLVLCSCVSVRSLIRLTGIRQPNRGICQFGHFRVLVAFPVVFVTDGQIMTPKVFPAKAAFVIANPKSKLLDQLREVLRVKHYSLRTEEAYGQWVRRYLKFHRNAAGAWIHPRELGAADVVAFLNHLANVESVAAGTQNQALNALSFLYTQVLGMELGDLGEFLRASKRRRVPVVLSIKGSVPVGSGCAVGVHGRHYFRPPAVSSQNSRLRQTSAWCPSGRTARPEGPGRARSPRRAVVVNQVARFGKVAVGGRPQRPAGAMIAINIGPSGTDHMAVFCLSEGNEASSVLTI